MSQVDAQLIADMSKVATVSDVAGAWQRFGARVNPPPPPAPGIDLPASMSKSTLLPLLKVGAVLDGAKAGTVIDLGGKWYACDGGWWLRNVKIQNGGLSVNAAAGTVTKLSNYSWTWPDYSVLTPSSVIPRMLSYQGPALELDSGDIHDANATPLFLPSAGTVTLRGMHFWNVYEHPNTDPQNVDHCDWIGALNGNIGKLLVADSYFEGAGAKAPAGARFNLQAFSGDIGVEFDNVWVQGGEGAAFQFNARNGHIIAGQRNDVRSWGHVGDNPKDRLDLTSTGGTVNVTDIGLSLVAPAAGAIDPATAYRKAA